MSMAKSMDRCFQCGVKSPSLSPCATCEVFAFCDDDCRGRAEQHHLPYCRYLAEKLGKSEGLPRPVRVSCFGCGEVLPRGADQFCLLCRVVAFHGRECYERRRHRALCRAIRRTLHKGKEEEEAGPEPELEAEAEPEPELEADPKPPSVDEKGLIHFELLVTCGSGEVIEREPDCACRPAKRMNRVLSDYPTDPDLQEKGKRFWKDGRDVSDDLGKTAREFFTPNTPVEIRISQN